MAPGEWRRRGQSGDAGNATRKAAGKAARAALEATNGLLKDGVFFGLCHRGADLRAAEERARRGGAAGDTESSNRRGEESEKSRSTERRGRDARALTSTASDRAFLTGRWGGSRNDKQLQEHMVQQQLVPI